MSHLTTLSLQPTVEVTLSPPPLVEITVDPEIVIDVTVPDPPLIEITAPGPQGPQGEPGPAGADGTGLDSVSMQFSRGGVLAPYVGTFRSYLHHSYTYDSCEVGVGVAPEGAPLIVDVLSSGVSIFSTPPAVPASEHRASSPVASTTQFVAGDYLTVNITSTGTTTPGSDLTVTLHLIRND